MKRLLLCLLCYLVSLNNLIAQSAFSVNTGLVSVPASHDNETAHALITIKKEFVSGNTISASEMNDKFLKIVNLLEELTGQSATTIQTKNVVIFGSYGSFTGSQGGVQGMNSNCENDQNKQYIETYGGITCSSVKAIISDDTQDIQDLYPNTDYKFYNYKGEMISNSWSNFENSSMNLAQWEVSFWDGKAGSCSNWNNTTGYGSAAKIGSGISQITWTNDSVVPCSASLNLLCGCEY